MIAFVLFTSILALLSKELYAALRFAGIIQIENQNPTFER